MTASSWGATTRRGIFWSTASYLAGQLLTFGSILILARLLVPAEFGVVAAITAYLWVLEVISDVGMKATVVYEQERGISARVQTAFTLNLAAASVLVALTQLLAPEIAAVFGLEDHVGLLRLASLSIALTALGNVHDSLLVRELDFRRRIIPDLARQLGRGVVSIVLAAAGLGAEALVIGMLAGTGAWVVAHWILTPFRPTLSFARGIARSMAGYGSGAAALAIVGTVAWSIQVGLIGRTLGAQALGLYVVARRLPEFLIEMMAFNVSKVAFPALARQRVTGELGVAPAALTLVRYQALYAAPMGAALAILAQPVVEVLFSPSWAPAGGILTAVAVLSGVASIVFPLGDALKASGKQWYLVALNVVNVGIVTAGILLLSSAGILVVAWLIAGSGIAFAFGVALIAWRQVGVSLRALLAAVRPGLLTAAGVAVGAAAARLVWPEPTLGPLVAGLAGSLTGGLIVLRLVDPAALRVIAGLLRRRPDRQADDPDGASGVTAIDSRPVSG